ncbi:hypothetical protein GF325_08565 [Candidatus Bathyarchaeota archaeon]|nr:hypothetical protein [Candidatus Bathyarchaeota archaeon]
MKNRMKHSTFAPGGQLVMRVADALRQMMIRENPLEKILKYLRNQAGNKKERAKSFMYFMQVIKHYNLLDALVRHVTRIKEISFHSNEIAWFVCLVLIFHVKQEAISSLHDALVKRRSVDHEVPQMTLDLLDEIFPVTPSWQYIHELILSVNLKTFLVAFPHPDSFALQFAHPTFFIDKMLQLVSEKRLIRLMQEHLEDRRFFIHARDATSLKELIAWLNVKNFTYQPDRDIPRLLQVLNEPGWKQAIASHPLNSCGKIALVDKASVMVVEMLDPRAGDTILDLCAAPFMKTSISFWHMGQHGRIIANDVNSSRIQAALDGMATIPRHSIHWLNSDARCMSSFYRGGEPDKILLDVPCTGSGSFMIHPRLKWVQSSRFLQQNVVLQQSILADVIKTCKENHWKETKILYANCSYYADEGEGVMDKIMPSIELIDLHDYQINQTRGLRVSSGWKGFKCSSKVARTFPDLHDGCQAFFMALFKVPVETP